MGFVFAVFLSKNSWLFIG